MRSREDDFSPGGTRVIVHKLEIVVFRTASFSQGWQNEKEDEMPHDQKTERAIEFRLFWGFSDGYRGGRIRLLVCNSRFCFVWEPWIIRLIFVFSSHVSPEPHT